MVLVVPPVEVDPVGVHQQEGKQNEEDLHGTLATVHKVSVENIGLLRGGQAVLRAQGKELQLF